MTGHDQFIMVTGRKAKKKTAHIVQQTRNRPNCSVPVNIDVDQLQLQFAICRRQLAEQSTFLNAITSHLGDILHSSTYNQYGNIVCFGLGSLLCKNGLHQLALLKYIHEYINIDCSKCYIYDPVFTQSERTFIQSLNTNFVVPNANNYGLDKINPNSITLVYMPHCGRALYNNFIWANWDTNRLRSLVLIGNSFTNLPVNHAESNEIEYVLRYSKLIDEYPFLDYVPSETAFNDTSIMIVNKQKFTTAMSNDHSFMSRSPDPPKYVVLKDEIS